MVILSLLLTQEGHGEVGCSKGVLYLTSRGRLTDIDWLAILVAGKGRGGMLLFLLFLYFHSCFSFFPVFLFYLLYYLSLGDNTK